MRILRRVSIAALALAAVSLAVAATLQSYSASWNAVTQGVDGSTLTAPVLYQLHAGTVPGGAKGGYGGQVSSLAEFVMPSVPGTLCLTVTAISNGLESDMSNEVCVTVPTPVVPPVKPKAPTGLAIK